MNPTDLVDLCDETDVKRVEAAHAIRHENDGLVTDSVLGMSDSEWIWTKRAKMTIPIDDPRRIDDFRTIRLRSFWSHSDPPVSRMNVREIVDTMWGLEWFLISEIHRDELNETEFREFYRVAANRAFTLFTAETDPEILNVVEYVRRSDDPLPSDEEVDGIDYDSGEEDDKAPRTKSSKRARVDERLTTNAAYVHDMNTVMRAIEDRLFTLWELGDSIPIPKSSLHSFRKSVFDEFASVKPGVALDFRRKWYQDSIVTLSHARVYKRKFKYDRRPKSRTILVKKSDALALECVPGTMEEMLVPSKRSKTTSRIDSDAALGFLSSGTKDDRVGKAWRGSGLDWRNPLKEGEIAWLGGNVYVLRGPDGTTYRGTSLTEVWKFRLELGDGFGFDDLGLRPSLEVPITTKEKSNEDEMDEDGDEMTDLWGSTDGSDPEHERDGGRNGRAFVEERVAVSSTRDPQR